MTKTLVLYNTAIRALAQCKRVDEVKHIRDQAMAIVVYAKQAKDRQLLEDATDIRMDAERKAGRLLASMVKNKGARGLGKAGLRDTTAPRLVELGINKTQSMRWQQLAALSEILYERRKRQAKRLAIASLNGAQEIIREVRAERQASKRFKRQARERQLGKLQLALPQKRYGVILADPEWQFEPWSQATGMDRAAANHYATSALEVIKSRDVISLAADDCTLWLWATVPLLREALEVMAAWGFLYKSNLVWAKDKIGTGYWFRNRHEHLLLGTRGKPPCPAAGGQWPSLLEAPVGKHSAKPDDVRQLIDEYFPTLPKIELNQRTARPGWDGWGDEAPPLPNCAAVDAQHNTSVQVDP